jgi:peptide/nickel transport system substrate-binding protein
MGVAYEPDCLTNIYTCGLIYSFSELLHEGINGLGPDCTPLLPRQAESVDITNDGKTFTFHLFEGITWSDGEPFTAEDMKLHWDWITTKSISDWYWITSEAVDWKLIDDLTFELNLSTPESGFLTGYTIWDWVLPPQVYGEMTEDDIWTYETDNPVGTGPYVITEWERGSYIIFDARPEYHLGKPPIDRIIVQFFANEDAMVAALTSGEIDVIFNDLGLQYYDKIVEDPNLTLWEMPPGTIIHLDFNQREEVAGFDKHPAILDPVVREAVDYAIDKQQIIDIALFGHGYLCPTAWTCGPAYEWGVDPSLEVFPQDLEKANQLLDDAGYLDSDGDGVRETPDGLPMVISLVYSVDISAGLTVSNMVKDWVAQIGIQLEVEAMESAMLNDVQVVTGEYEMAVRWWGAEMDPSSMRDLYSCDAAMPFVGWCNEDFEAALDQVQMSYGSDRDQYMDAMNEAYQADRPYIYLAGIVSLGAFRNDRLEMPIDACPYFGGLMSWYSVMNTVVK